MKGLIAVAILATLLVVGLLWKHDGDARRDGQIAMLTTQVTRDSVARDSLTKLTDKATTAVVAKIDTFARVDTVWARHRDTLTATVTKIVHDTAVADTTKIRELSDLVEVTKRKADSTVKAGEEVANAARVTLMQAFAAERKAWSEERSHQQEEITLLKRQSRHWGLCAMPAGVGGTLLPDHTIKGGLQAGAGVCYRY